MSHTIQIDDDVYESLKKMADPFEDTPNTVIKKLLAGQRTKKASTPRTSAKKGRARKAAAKKTRAKRASNKKASTNGRIKKAAPARRKRRRKVTPLQTYQNWVLHTLWNNFNGAGKKSDITQATIAAMDEQKVLTENDHRVLSNGETRAAHTVTLGRNKLKEKGYIKADSPRGVWELTEEGIEKAKALKTQLAGNSEA